jgi:hypothetical protein
MNIVMLSTSSGIYAGDEKMRNLKIMLSQFVKPKPNSISTVQECDATMMKREQMLVTQKEQLRISN